MIGESLVHNEIMIATGEACLGDLSVRWKFVTPELAKKYLLSNNRNRRLIDSLASRYSEEMIAGNWAVTHQGIALGKDGALYDGQHRLTAIVKSGVGQWLLITEGLDDAAIEALDRGRVRSLSHTLTIMGHKHSGTQAVATARVMWFGPNPGFCSRAIPDTILRKFMDRYDESLTFAMSMPKGVTVIMRGLLARAYLRVSPSLLIRFIDAYLDLVPHEDQRPEDSTARHLHRVISDHMSHSGGGSSRGVAYRKAQAGLHFWLSGKITNRIYEREEDLFPLPDDGSDGDKA